MEFRLGFESSRFDSWLLLFPTFFKNKWIIGCSSNLQIKIELHQVRTVQTQKMTAEQNRQTNGKKITEIRYLLLESRLVCPASSSSSSVQENDSKSSSRASMTRSESESSSQPSPDDDVTTAEPDPVVVDVSRRC